MGGRREKVGFRRERAGASGPGGRAQVSLRAGLGT
jgi:hypothetical protein